MNANDISRLNASFSEASAQEVLTHAVETSGQRLTVASSLGLEDQILTHMLSQLTDAMDIFVLDTGRLHQETYDLMATTSLQYAFQYRVFFPNQADVEAMVSTHGPNHFYQSIDHRKSCCGVRKVAPLSRALDGYGGWVTGIRRAQSIDRALTPFFEWDEAHGLLKVNPLIKWSKDDVWNYIKRHDVPYNSLHDQGYPSIGCAPCTRAVTPGEDDRAGRWWWEDAVKKECGLHVNLDDKMESNDG